MQSWIGVPFDDHLHYFLYKFLQLNSENDENGQKSGYFSDFFIPKKMLHKTFQIECIFVTFKIFYSIIDFQERVENSRKRDFGKILPPSKILFFSQRDQNQNIWINFGVFGEPFFRKEKIRKITAILAVFVIFTFQLQKFIQKIVKMVREPEAPLQHQN